MWISVPKAQAQDFESLFRDFDANTLTRTDKRFLQTALAFEGHYAGLLDGAWGKLSREALSRYSRAEFGSNTANWHMAMLAHSFLGLVQRDGWEYFFVEPAGISLLWPFSAIIVDEPTDGFINYRHSQSSLGISIAIQSAEKAQFSHDFVLNRHELPSEPYTLRKSNLAISTSKTRDGFTRYARSNFVDGAWSTVLLSANKSDEAILTAMAASIQLGNSPRLQITRNGPLDQAIYKADQFVKKAEEEQKQASGQPAAPTPAAQAPEGRTTGSGSGFFVSARGIVMTNAHVVQGCARIFVDDRPAEILAQSDEFDLALLEVDGATPGGVAVFSASSANLNADVTAVGYPYGGLLGGLNVTRGSVSSLKGLGGDLTTMQITAPIQKGNSGGPILASDGEVIGVVVSKLNARKTVDVLGDMPQNVNFAVRGEIARLFMSQHAIEPLLSLQNNRLEPEALAQKAASFTVFVECR